MKAKTTMHEKKGRAVSGLLLLVMAITAVVASLFLVRSAGLQVPAPFAPDQILTEEPGAETRRPAPRITAHTIPTDEEIVRTIEVQDRRARALAETITERKKKAAIVRGRVGLKEGTSEKTPVQSSAKKERKKPPAETLQKVQSQSYIVH